MFGFVFPVDWRNCETCGWNRGQRYHLSGWSKNTSLYSVLGFWTCWTQQDDSFRLISLSVSADKGNWKRVHPDDRAGWSSGEPATRDCEGLRLLRDRYASNLFIPYTFSCSMQLHTELTLYLWFVLCENAWTGEWFLAFFSFCRWFGCNWLPLTVSCSVRVWSWAERAQPFFLPILQLATNFFKT